MLLAIPQWELEIDVYDLKKGPEPAMVIPTRF